MDVEPRMRTLATLMVVLIVGAVVGIVVAKASLEYFRSRMGEKFEKVKHIWHAFECTFTIGMVIVLINLALLSALLLIYTKSYKETKSSFMLGLIIFLSVLVVQTILSLPVLHVSVGAMLYHTRITTILPNLFEMIALIILFMLSME